jgi:methylmalonyl-CoA epimerase
VRVCFVPAGRPDGSPAAARLELLEPAGEDTPLARFLARRGEGLHHVCFAVDGIVEELTRLEALGLEPVDRTPRRGALGGLVVFLHPRTAHGVLIELLQRDPAATAPAGELPAPEPPAPAGP